MHAVLETKMVLNANLSICSPELEKYSVLRFFKDRWQDGATDIQGTKFIGPFLCLVVLRMHVKRERGLC